MYIIILGGQNDNNGIFSRCTERRLEKFYEIYHLYKNSEPKVIISGGNRYSDKSHCYYIKQELLNKIPNININKEFEENNNTIDEAINICKYLNENNSKHVIIITSNWHMPRVKYLFGKVFELQDNINVEYVETDETEIELKKEEEIKLYNLKHKPYGKWKEYNWKIYKKINS